MAGAVVIVDPGHGGVDSGALGHHVREKDVNLAVAGLLAARLRAAGAVVDVTRDADVEPGVQTGHRRYRQGLLARKALAERRHAHIVVSIHCNHVDAPSARGPAVFYHRGMDISLPLARAVAAQLATLAGRPCPVFANGQLVLSSAGIPSINVEIGFLSNAKDARLLIDPLYQRQVAAAISRGLVGFWDASRQAQSSGSTSAGPGHAPT